MQLSKQPLSTNDTEKLLTIGRAKYPISKQIPIMSFAVVLIATILISFFFYFETEKLLTKQTEHELAIETSLVEPIIEQLYSQAYSDTLFLSKTPAIQEMITAIKNSNKENSRLWRSRLEQIFSEFIAHKDYYYQVRYIGLANNGLELANVRNDVPQKITPEQALQEKLNRPYFQATMQRADGDVYFSKVELAKNHGRIELPFKPVLRIATPVFDESTQAFFGIIVINLDFNQFVLTLKEKMLGQLSFYLTNQAGDFIYHPDNTKTFGFDLGERHLLQNDFPSLQNVVENNLAEMSLIRVNIDNKSYLGHFRNLALNKFSGANPLNLLVLKDTSEIELKLQSLKIKSILFGGILALVTLVIAIFLAKKITTPLQQITENISALEKSTSVQKLPLASNSEVGVLARCFHNLLIQIQSALKEQQHSALLAKQAANKITAIFNSTAEGFITINEQGIITSFNAAAQLMFGYSEVEVVGENISILMPTNHSIKHDEYIKNYLATGLAGIIGVGRKLTAKKKSGEMFPIHLAISKAENEEGIIFTGVIRDTSKEALLELEKEAHQKELIEVNERMSLATHAANIGIWQYDILSDRLEWDDQMFIIYGYDKTKFNNTITDWKSAVHPDDLEDSVSAINNAIKNKSSFEHEFRVIQDNGNIRYIKAMALTKQNDAGETNQIIGVNFDVTERKEVERQHIAAKEIAEEATRHKAEFLASMSHEIRTPMNGILGMLGLLKRNPLSDEQLHRVNLANSSAEALLNLLNDILDFSKVEAGKLDLEIIDFDLRKLFGEFVESVALKGQEKNIEIILDNRGIEQSHVKGDPGRIRQILHNLTSNAIKFTQQGEIVITAALVKKEANSDKLLLQCQVTDTGIGIPEKKVAIIFESFTQVDASTTRQYGGTGLGLAICKQLCTMMNGDISVESTLDKGSTFTFTIELSESDHAYEVMPSTPINNTEILIVDDNTTNLLVLKEQLELWGANVHQADSGESALQLLNQSVILEQEGSSAGVKSKEKSPIKIAFLDMHMPKMNGAMLAKKITETPKFAHIKLVMMTSMATRGDASYFASRGFSAYFPKPAVTGDLLKALQLCLAKNETSNEQTPLITHHYLQDLENNSITQNTDDEIRKLTHCRLLLVEDNRINQEVARHILEDLGITPDIAANGLEALASLKAANEDTPFNIVLMDCQMPEMDGYQATKAIRSGKSGEINKDITIIAMTANAMAGDKEKCLAAGMTDYLSKPINSASLKEKILMHLMPQFIDDGLGEYHPKSISLAPMAEQEVIEDKTALLSQKQNTVTTDNETTNNNISQDTNIDLTWDSDDFAKRLTYNDAIQQKLLALFLEETPSLINELEQSVAKDDLLQQQEVSHKIQGMTANISAKKLSALAKQFNKYAKEAKSVETKALITQLVCEYNNLTKLLKEAQITH
ncbi:response regulator [Colwellia sp. D2M02]|uniref:response regulator n=1 Tax=Colwellia sp. D2M02 TaxID=2841562 RepID=UPI001C08CEE9|nr:response regulator [Colwellia sp. D2M02]MBU2894016.1 response regulator [Colwellia sp. D2M02]